MKLGTADESVPVVVWGPSGDDTPADPMETGTVPSEEPTSIETEEKPTEVGTDGNAPSEEFLPPEAAKEEAEVPTGETDPVDGEAADPVDGAASEEIAPVEGKEEQTEIVTDDGEADNPGAVLTLSAALSPAYEMSEAEDEADRPSDEEPPFTTSAYVAPGGAVGSLSGGRRGKHGLRAPAEDRRRHGLRHRHTVRQGQGGAGEGHRI